MEPYGSAAIEILVHSFPQCLQTDFTTKGNHVAEGFNLANSHHGSTNLVQKHSRLGQCNRTAVEVWRCHLDTWGARVTKGRPDSSVVGVCVSPRKGGTNVADVSLEWSRT